MAIKRAAENHLSRRELLLQRFKRINYKKPVNFIQRRPVVSFFMSLGILLILIIASNFLFKPASEEIKKSDAGKPVSIYSIGSAPRLRMQAQVEKSGVIKITALSGGVVQNINVTEGQSVAKGTNLVSLSSNYQGGNSLAVMSSIAAANYKNVKDTYDTNKDLINKQRDVANKNFDTQDKLRDITSQSVEETNNLIALNDDILSTLNSNRAAYEASNSAGTNDQLILQTKELTTQFQSANNQLKNAIRNARFTSDSGNSPAQLNSLQRDIALKQLDLQDKALELNKEVSRLNLLASQIAAATMYPAAPFAGKVERIHVKVGEAVAPGTPLVTLSGDTQKLQAVALVSNQIARNISLAEESTLHIGDKTINLLPAFVSTEATDNNLYAAIFNVPDEYAYLVSDKGFVDVDIVVGSPNTSSAVPFVPLDSVFQSQDSAFLFVDENNKAVSKKVELGDVLGRFVEVKSGLKEGDQVILNRNVVAGEKVKTN